MQDIVITAARRTPVGSFLGAYAATPAHELGRVAIEAALADSGVKAVVQPGGSIRDEEVIAAAKEAGVTMYLTGTRHFAH